MRIRKTVSRLLGSAMACSSSQYHCASSPPRDLWPPVAAGSPGMGMADVCELNQSPWDVYPNLHLFSTEYYQDLEQPSISKKEEEEKEAEIKEEKQIIIWENTGGISENAGAISENSDGPIRVCQKPPTTASRSSSKKKKDKTEKKKEDDDVMLCKKNDGKKWYCKRPAQLPNLLCEYHLSQSRSYYNTNKEKEVSSQCHVECDSTKRRQKPRGPNGGGVSPYYYYNGFGPSTRRRRNGASDDGGGHDVKDGTDHTMHVDDKERLDVSYSDMDIDEVSDEEIAGELVTDTNEEERRVRSKQGRKPVKCRSLKSLL